jgi:hypothetical protein
MIVRSARCPVGPVGVGKTYYNTGFGEVVHSVKSRKRLGRLDRCARAFHHSKMVRGSPRRYHTLHPALLVDQVCPMGLVVAASVERQYQGGGFQCREGGLVLRVAIQNAYTEVRAKSVGNDFNAGEEMGWHPAPLTLILRFLHSPQTPRFRATAVLCFTDLDNGPWRPACDFLDAR